MQKDDPKLSPWIIVAAIACCALPLLILFGGGSILAFIGGYFTGSNLLLILSLVFALVFVWLLLKRRNRE